MLLDSVSMTEALIIVNYRAFFHLVQPTVEDKLIVDVGERLVLEEELLMVCDNGAQIFGGSKSWS